MVLYLEPRPPVYQALKYDPQDPACSADSLESWFRSGGVDYETLTITADSNGFTVIAEYGPDTATNSGVVGDWILTSIPASAFIEVVSMEVITKRYSIIASTP